MKRLLVTILTISFFLSSFITDTGANSSVTMYALDGRRSTVSVQDVDAWKSVGWYLSKPIKVYSLDGRTLTIPEEHFSAYAQVGWYSEPVAKLYSLDGRTIIVTLKEVSLYRSVGWYPLHAFFFEANLYQTQLHFPLKYEMYYAGTPDSGDIPRYIYSSAYSSPVKISSVDFYEKRNCVSVTLPLKDVFPYLQLYTDSRGMLSANDINAAFRNNELYGLNYRDPHYYDAAYGHFSELVGSYYATNYFYGEYDYAGISINHNGYNQVDFYNATCTFYTLV